MTDNYKLMFSIFDTVTNLYEPPFVDINKGSALRRIQDLMQSNPNSQYAKFPDNFRLCCIGTWSDLTAQVNVNDVEIVDELANIVKEN